MADESTSGKETAPKDEGEAGAGSRRPRRRPRVSARQVAHGAKVGSDAIRNRVASIVWLVAVICAAVLALGAVLIALQDNVRSGNAIVEALTGAGNAIAGPFGDVENGDFGGGVFNLSTAPREALANWGAAAVCYLVIGRILDRIIRP